MAQECRADIILSVGGGSPIDAAKEIAFFLHQEESGRWIPSIAVPTTLSAAETTQIAGYTDHYGKKVAAIDPELVPKGLSSLPLSTSVFSNACRLHLSGAKSLS
jgi:alcohol dehydrogenase class IV